MKNTVVPPTKKLLGTLALIGLMSVVLAKFFSDLAFADDLPSAASLAGNSQYLGEYEVKTVVGNTKLEPKGNLCAQEDPAKPHSIDPHCGQKVWVYKSSDGKLVLLDAVDADGQYNDRIVSFASTDTGPYSCSLATAQQSGVFTPGLIAQTTPNVLTGGKIGMTEALTDTLLQPILGVGASYSEVTTQGTSIIVREVMEARVLLVGNVNVDKTITLTPVTTD
jgi:hypothetical protein